MASTDIAPGALLGGKFRVERVLGRGGMGVVLEATNTQIDQKVALKLLARGADDPAMAERFTREAKAAAKLRSEHVARVYDVGRDEQHGPFIVMELLDGKTLADLVKEGRLPVHRAVEHLIDACEGLAEAHARGIIHQDVKPANLFVVSGDDGKPCVKLLDFGIATMRTAEQRKLEGKSSAPRSQGTPAYLAPEQLRGADTLDHRADVWALGCVLYELLAGERAFAAERFTELVTKILEAPHAPIPAGVELPQGVKDAIDRCLEKDPAKRFHSTGALAIALMPYARRRAHSSVAKAVAHVKAAGLDPDLQMPPSIPPPAGSDSAEIPLASLPSAPQKRSPLAGIILVAFVLGGGGIAAYALTRSTQKSADIAPSATTPVQTATPSATTVGTTPTPPPAEPSGVVAVESASSEPLPLPHATGPRVPKPKPSAAASSDPNAEIRRTR